MKRFFLPLIVAVACSVLTVVPAAGSVLTDALSYDGVIDVLQDNSVSLALWDVANPGVVGPGDVIAGLIHWNQNIQDGPLVAPTAHALFSAQILSGPLVTGRGIGFNPALFFEVGAPPAAFSLAALLPKQSAANGGFGASTIGVSLSATGGPDLSAVPFAGVLLALDVAPWTVDLTFGFVGAPVAGPSGLLTRTAPNNAGGVDFFDADMRDHKGPGADKIFYTADDTGPDGVISISDADGDGYVDEWDDFNGKGPGAFIVGTQTGQEAAAFSVLINNITPPGGLLAVPATDLAGTLTSAELALLPQTQIGQATSSQVGNGYQFADNAFAAINPVPEPGSILVWGGMLGAILAFGAWRRRRK